MIAKKLVRTSCGNRFLLSPNTKFMCHKLFKGSTLAAGVM